MPHITIEHSANIAELVDVDALVATVHAAALRDGLPALEGLRTRAVARDRYLIADADPSYGFVALTARVGPGRSEAEIERFLKNLADAVDEALVPLWPQHPVALSVEVQLIDPRLRINRNRVRSRLVERGVVQP